MGIGLGGGLGLHPDTWAKVRGDDLSGRDDFLSLCGDEV